ncbi:MAG: DSD1 family PLP-dependent enzyme [Ectothiorhodospiraceae bacterium]|nr:DSD1 family PLP-dependent enzyme [Ectothiorhodospiraceae bacterium]
MRELNRPAEVGMPMEDVDTPCLLVDLDALERNIARLAQYASQHGVRLRPHAKTHKSADIALLQMAHGAVGVCCQKVSEAEAMVRGGVRDVLVSNQVVNPRMIDRLAALAGEARVAVCVDNEANVAAIAAAAAAQLRGTRIDVLVEIDVGAGRCGVAPGEEAVALARRVAAAPSLRFAGLQAYQGSAQHVRDYHRRKALIDTAVKRTAGTVEQLASAGLPPDVITGAGTGTYELEAASKVYTELQCGSYVFMDADYQRVRLADDQPMDTFENSLFLYSMIMSKTRPGRAVCDAGLKAHSVDSGLPVVHDLPDVTYTQASDEHGVLDDPGDTLKLGDRLRLVPGHCDPTGYLAVLRVGVRNGRVECLWPVSARGMVL